MSGKQLDWQPSDSYGAQTTTVVVGTSITVNRLILGATQIAFFEDEIILLRTVGVFRVAYQAETPPGFVNIAMRLRLVLENQQTGVTANAGDDLDDSAVAEESFLSERRFRLVHQTAVEMRNTNALQRNDYVAVDPYYQNWDVPGIRKLRIPQALVMSVRISSASALDELILQDFFRCLIRH